jgi:hypothetical protein
MKSFLLIVITTVIMGFSSIIHAQGDFAIMSASKNNFLYKGIENPVEFYVPFKIKEIKVIGGKFVSKVVSDSVTNKKSKADDVWQLTQENGYFSIIPDCEAKVVEVIFVGKKSSMSKYFSSLPVPNPIVKFGGRTAADTHISRGSAMVESGVYAYQAEDFVYMGLMYNIADFKIQITHEGKIEEFVCQGDNFSVEVRVSLSKIRTGDRIVIYDVNVTGACGLIHLEDRLDLLVQ